MSVNRDKTGRACVFALLLSGGCYFPNDSYVNPEIHPPGAIQAGLDIANLNDPHALVYPTTFTFDVVTGGKQIMSVQVFKDGEAWIHSSYERVNFDLNPDDYGDGDHEILIKVRLSSGSGSIAELLQAEYYEFEKVFTFTVDKSPPQAVSGMTTAIEDGKLVLRWNKPDHEHFEYLIQRTYWYGDNTGSQKFIRIKDTSTTQFIDDCFTGGYITYSVLLESPSFSVSSAVRTFEFEPVAINATMDADNLVKVSWTDPHDFGDSVYVTVATSDETTNFPAQAGQMVVDTLILGDQMLVSFKIIRAGYEPEGYQKDFTFQPGLRTKPFDDIRLLPSNKLILTKVYPDDPNRRTHMYRYDAASMAIEDSVILDKRSSGLLISPDGAHAYILHYANLSQSEVLLIKFDPLNFSEPATVIDIPPSYNGNYLVAAKKFSLSNENILLFEDARHTTPRVIEIDLNSKSVTWSKDNVNNPILSHDGSLLVVKDGGSGQIWKKNGSIWELSANVPAGDFYFTAETMLIVTSNNFTGIYDPNNTSAGSVLQPIHTSSIQITNYDHITNSLISEQITDDHVSTITVLDTELTEKFKVRANVYHEYPDCAHIYTGSAHYITSGFMEKIEL